MFAAPRRSMPIRPFAGRGYRLGNSLTRKPDEMNEREHQEHDLKTENENKGTPMTLNEARRQNKASGAPQVILDDSPPQAVDETQFMMVDDTQGMMVDDTQGMMVDDTQGKMVDDDWDEEHERLVREYEELMESTDPTKDPTNADENNVTYLHANEAHDKLNDIKDILSDWGFRLQNLKYVKQLRNDIDDLVMQVTIDLSVFEANLWQEYPHPSHSYVSMNN